MSDKIDMIYDLLKTEREDTKQFQREVREATGDLQERLTKIEVLDEIQNQQLAEHIRRTDLLEGLYKQSEERIAKLEEPVVVRSTLKKWLVGLGAVAGACASIFGLIKLFL